MMRASRERIAEKRGQGSVTILLTGGTGFIGSHIAVRLLEEGHSVILLCRPARGMTSHQRVHSLLQWFRIDEGAVSKLKVIEGFIDRSRFGLSRSLFAGLSGSIDEIVHCAASTSFSERRREEAERANGDALRNVLDLAARGGCYYLHLLSTVFLAGKRSGVCDEGLTEADAFHNVYEETKHAGEGYATEVCRREGIGLNIYRPSIVYGNSKDGRSLRFNALYYPVRTLLFLKDIFERDIRENGGKRAQKMGVRREKDDAIFLPIRMKGEEHGGINLIPIDYLVDSFMAIMDACLDGGIFNIVSSKPAKLRDLIEYTKVMFHITGITTAKRGDFDHVPRNAIEILFDCYVRAYSPYIRDTRIFSNEKTEAIIRERGIRCPDMDFAMFSRCMNYTLEVNWGKGSFQGPCE